ncbi:class I SAM-dependent methyltransferase [Betaproteobacteria bacterium]|nr:class I SAM-dependent methyltransferase [Betaproteobacteria bacterium]
MHSKKVCIIYNDKQFGINIEKFSNALLNWLRNELGILESTNLQTEILWLTEGCDENSTEKKQGNEFNNTFVRTDKLLNVMDESFDEYLPKPPEKFDITILLSLSSTEDLRYRYVFASLFSKTAPYIYIYGNANLYQYDQTFNQIIPAFDRKETRIYTFSKDKAFKYMDRVHRHCIGEIIKLGNVEESFSEKAKRLPDKLIYKEAQLTSDLLQHTPEWQQEQYGYSFSIFRFMDKRIVYSPDYYNSIAWYIDEVLKSARIEQPRILDVGCGSGFLTCYLKGKIPHGDIYGVDASEPRVRSSKRHSYLRDINVTYDIGSMSKLNFPDNYFDLVCTTAALEQAGSELNSALKELSRVSKRFLILLEPTTEYFGTFPGMWHINRAGWANTYYQSLTQLKFSWHVRPPLLTQYYNPNALFVIDKKTNKHLPLEYPHLFSDSIKKWPGGIIEKKYEETFPDKSDDLQNSSK